MSATVEDPRIIEFDVRTDEMLVNMGPQHPSTHGVLRLVLRTDGEIVSEVVPHIGYLHRCAEKIGENLTPRQWIPYTDRMDYLAGMNMNLGWSLAVEKLMGYRVPERGRHLRVLIAELNRIASHLVGMGAYGLDLGTFSPFLYAFREREKILDLFEEACGARLTYSYLTPGGATADLPRGWLQKCEEFLDQFNADYPGVSRAAHDQFDFREAHGRHRRACRPRWRSISARAARCFAAAASITTCAAMARKSTRRCTKAMPSKSSASANGHYPRDHDYPTVPHEAVLGDCWHRFYVRMLEVVQSVDLCAPGDRPLQHVDRQPRRADEAHRKSCPRASVTSKPNAQRARWASISSARGDSIPWRARARSSSFCNLVGHQCARAAAA